MAEHIQWSYQIYYVYTMINVLVHQYFVFFNMLCQFIALHWLQKLTCSVSTQTYNHTQTHLYIYTNTNTHTHNHTQTHLYYYTFTQTNIHTWNDYYKLITTFPVNHV